MADKEEKKEPGRRDILRKVAEAVQSIGDRAITGHELARVLLPVIGAVGSYADDYHSARKEMDGDHKYLRRARNSSQYVRELDSSKDKEAVQRSMAFLRQKCHEKFGDKEGDDKFQDIMDDVVDWCNENKKSVLESICDAAKQAGFTDEEARKKAAEAVKGTGADDTKKEKEETDKLDKGEKAEEGEKKEDDGPLDRKSFDEASEKEDKDREDERKGEKKRDEREEKDKKDEAEGGRKANEEERKEREDKKKEPDAEDVISRGKDPHERGEAPKRGEPDPDELSRLSSSRDPKDKARYKKLLGY